MTSSAYSKYMVIISALIFSLGFSAISTADENTPFPRILVNAQGSVDVAPDMAILSLTVTREADTARDALDANSSAMGEVLAAMKAEGIEARDLQTSGFSIYPRYSRPKANTSGEREPPEIIGYTVRNTLSVRVRDISTVGTVLDKSVTLGVNEGGNIQFTNADPSAAIDQARTKAVKRAVAKANTLASAAGVKTGKILEISEQHYNPRPAPMMGERMSMASSAKAVPVASGENTYSVTVNMSFAIEQ